MPTKMLLPNQHLPLHEIYGQHDCCLCKSEARIAALEASLRTCTEERDAERARAAAEADRLRDRWMEEAAAHDRTRRRLAGRERELARLRETFYKGRVAEATK